MPRIESRIDVRSEGFAANRAAMLEALAEVRAHEDGLRDQAERARTRIEGRGQLMPRDRLERVLDRGSPFLELSPLAGFLDDAGDPSEIAGGSHIGIGHVSGVRCLVVAHNAALKGGTITPSSQVKYLRAQDIAMINKLPVVLLAESGGANLLYQAGIFVRGGRGFCNQSRMSAQGLPQVTVVHGSSTAGGAYLPGLSDYVIAVRKQAKIFLAGPPLLKAATGEIATDEELGGAEMHATISGTAEYMAEDDAQAIDIAREVVAKLRWNDALPPQTSPSYEEPAYDPGELAGIAPMDYRKPYDVREVIARIVDGSDFLGFKQDFGPLTICGHAAIQGHPIGIIGNNGPIDPDGSVKAAQFIQLCCQSDTPIVYLANTTGYLVGKEPEERGAIKHGSKMIQAVANATVPQLTLNIGGNFGAGNYGMCGRSFDPRFLFAWPNAKLSVMGGEQAAKVMSIITEEKWVRQNKEVDREALDAMEQAIIDQFNKEASALYCTSRVWDDGIIDPRDTRTVLGIALSICREAERRPLRSNTFGVARG